MSRKLTTDNFIESATKKHNGLYDYSKSVYVNGRNKVIITCPKHGEFKQRADSHLAGLGCSKCANGTRTQQEFIEEATKIHNGFYDYSKTVYRKQMDKITIICPVHGDFKQIAQNHLDLGCGCNKCGGRIKLTTEEFIERSTKIHNGFYDYSKSVYGGCEKKVIIICPKHGEFKQKAESHLQGQGCDKCGGSDKKTTSYFIERSTKIHNDFYDYSKTVYTNSKNKVIIICPKHGVFEQKADAHWLGSGCAKCTRHISKKETLWLDLLNVQIECRQKAIKIDGRIFRADAVDIENKIVWEFYGDYWHGNPNKYPPNGVNVINKKNFGELYAITMAREKVLIDAGYKVISIWESDFQVQTRFNEK